MGMDVGKPVQESIGPKADVAGREGSRLMNTVANVLLAATAINLVQDMSGPKMGIGSSILEVTGNKGEVVGNTRGNLMYAVVAESMIAGSFSLAQDLSQVAPAQHVNAKPSFNNTSKLSS
jgi:hypothetical protein